MHRPLKSGLPWLAMIVVVTIAAYQLRRQGRLWWCACGGLNLWSGDIWSPHNSQHLFDPYSFTHLLHGMIAYGLLAWLCPKLPSVWRLCLAVGLEALWEIVENSPIVIQRYRLATLAIGYQGDSVINSLGDMLSAAAGFLAARRLGLRGSIVLFLAIEATLLLWIRDSLLLNVIMLIHPCDAIRAWQLR
jgi:hypothetical protein